MLEEWINEMFEKGLCDVVKRDPIDILLNLSGERIGDEEDCMILWGVMQCKYGGVSTPTL